MAHVRKQIRDWVKGRLTGLGYSPVSHLSRAFQESEIANWVVTTTTEEIELAQMGPGSREQYRGLDVVTTACVRGTSAVDDTLDSMAEAFEQDWADRTAGGLCRDRQLIGVEMDLAGEGDQIIGTCALTWRVDYVTDETVPQTAR